MGRGTGRASVRVRVRVRVGVRVNKLVYQIGFTNLFRSQGRENILAAASSSSSSSKQQQQQQQAAAASSKQQLSSFLPIHISINIDGILPKLSWYIVLMMPCNHTKFRVKTHQAAGSVGKKA